MVTLTADVVITVFGTKGNSLREGNIVVAGLWQKAGRFSFVLPVAWALLILAIAFLLARISQSLTLWWLYAVFAGHLIGFLSWTPLNVVKPFLASWNRWTLLAVFLFLVVIIGLVLSRLHIRYSV
jgi:hypothetical protein